MPYAPARRLLHVAQPVEAGVAVVARQLAEHQVSCGHHVTIACPPEGSLPAWARSIGADTLSWPATRSPGRAVVDETRRLSRLVREQRPDLVHLHSSKAGLAGRLAVRGHVPTVFQPHAWSFLAVDGVMGAASTRWERVGARWADAIICVSQAEKTLGEQASIAGRFHVCANGVDTRHFVPADPGQRAEARAGLGLPPSSPVVLCVGRLDRQKGQDLLLAAWRRLLEAGRDHGATLVLVGDGPDRGQLEASAPPQVRFAGDQPDVRRWYAAADLFVQPSRWEGASLSIREAMAAGLSVVATAVAGNSDVPGLGDALVAVDDVDGLARAIGERLDDEPLRRREGQTCRDTAQRFFGLDTALASVDAVYDAVLSARAGSR